MISRASSKKSATSFVVSAGKSSYDALSEAIIARPYLTREVEAYIADAMAKKSLDREDAIKWLLKEVRSQQHDVA